VGAFSWLDFPPPWRSRCTSSFSVVTQRQRVRELRCRLEAGHSGGHWHPHFRKTGTPPKTGFPEPYACTTMREHGTQTPGMGITGECSSLPTRPGEQVFLSDPILQRLVSSFTVRIESGSWTAALGGSGVQRESVDSDE
jgi:hypothetical protein